VDACCHPRARLAVALAAHSGLKTGQVRELVFSDLVEFSIASKQFTQIPSRISLRNQVTRRKYYSFLSTAGCRWLLEDLKTRRQPLTAGSPVVTGVASREAEKTVHGAGFRWGDLRDYFHACFMTTMISSSSVPVDFMLGHMIDEAALTHVWRFFDPQRIKWMRARYAQVEKQYFV
jgi:hypothetical protein